MFVLNWVQNPIKGDGWVEVAGGTLAASQIKVRFASMANTYRTFALPEGRYCVCSDIGMEMARQSVFQESDG
jgi:hypothetical protein